MYLTKDPGGRGVKDQRFIRGKLVVGGACLGIPRV